MASCLDNHTIHRMVTVASVEARMSSVVAYRCPNTDNEVVTAIQTDNVTLMRMQASKLAIWVWCPHCMAGHQISADAAQVQDSRRLASLTAD